MIGRATAGQDVRVGRVGGPVLQNDQFGRPARRQLLVGDTIDGLVQVSEVGWCSGMKMEARGMRVRSLPRV